MADDTQRFANCTPHRYLLEQTAETLRWQFPDAVTELLAGSPVRIGPSASSSTG